MLFRARLALTVAMKLVRRMTRPRLFADDPVAMLGIADAVYTSAPYLLSGYGQYIEGYQRAVSG